jgi:hypothetical protein
MIYNGSFDCKEDVLESFKVPKEDHHMHIIYANYNHEDYDGSAFVLFIKDGKLYELYGSHCSCHGLEQCYDPEQISLPILKEKIKRGTYVFSSPEIKEFFVDLDTMTDEEFEFLLYLKF